MAWGLADGVGSGWFEARGGNMLLGLLIEDAPDTAGAATDVPRAGLKSGLAAGLG